MRNSKHRPSVKQQPKPKSELKSVVRVTTFYPDKLINSVPHILSVIRFDNGEAVTRDNLHLYVSGFCEYRSYILQCMIDENVTIECLDSERGDAWLVTYPNGIMRLIRKFRYKEKDK